MIPRERPYSHSERRESTPHGAQPRRVEAILTRQPVEFTDDSQSAQRSVASLLSLSRSSATAPVTARATPATNA
jgi:hypothetical protein